MRKLVCLLTCTFLLLAGCSAPETTATATPNPTLLAIARMLTQTRAAPTATRTATPAPSQAVTPTSTIEIPVTGSETLPAPLGEPLLFAEGNARLAIVGMEARTELGEQQAAEGYVFLDIEMVIENIGSAVVSYNRLDFRLLTTEGEEVLPGTLAAGPLLRGGLLLPGERVRGHATFNTPQSDAVLLHFRPAGTGEDWWLEGKRNTSLAGRPTPFAIWPSAGTASSGQRVEQDGIALEIRGVTTAARMPQGRPPDGMRFVALDVAIFNTARTITPYNPLYFRVKDAQGFEYVSILGAPEESLQPGSLGEGQSVQGIVFFELPEELDAALVTYQPGVLFEEYPQLRVAIDIPSR